MHTVKEFQVLLMNINNSIRHYLFVCTQLSGSKYCYVSLTIKQHLFVYSPLNDQTVLFQTIQFYISHLLSNSSI